jgi:prepilin-type N-terminal cleavage/methylation domain-containing protein
MKLRLSPSPTTAGFTLIEVLVVVIMIAVLAAIAAPSWLALVNNQRVGTARSQIAESLRDAQAQAKRTKTRRVFVIDQNINSPRIAVVNAAQLPGNFEATGITSLASINKWQSLGNGNIQEGTLAFTVDPPSSKGAVNFIVFDDYGSPTTSSGNAPFPFTITLNIKNSGSKRCVSVITAVGGLGEAADGDCTPANFSGANSK